MAQINMMQGNVDLSYRIKGTKGSGTLYFTSVRRDKGLPFDICVSSLASVASFALMPFQYDSR